MRAFANLTAAIRLHHHPKRHRIKLRWLSLKERSELSERVAQANCLCVCFLLLSLFLAFSLLLFLSLFLFLSVALGRANKLTLTFIPPKPRAFILLRFYCSPLLAFLQLSVCSSRNNNTKRQVLMSGTSLLLSLPVDIRTPLGFFLLRPQQPTSKAQIILSFRLHLLPATKQASGSNDHDASILSLFLSFAVFLFLSLPNDDHDDAKERQKKWCDFPQLDRQFSATTSHSSSQTLNSHQVSSALWPFASQYSHSANLLLSNTVCATFTLPTDRAQHYFFGARTSTFYGSTWSLCRMQGC